MESVDLLIRHDNILYCHWSLVVLGLVLLTCYWYKCMLKNNESFVSQLDERKKLMDKIYAEDTPNVQEDVNPVPELIKTIKGSSYYPMEYPRRIDSLTNPITEKMLRDNLSGL